MNQWNNEYEVSQKMRGYHMNNVIRNMLLILQESFLVYMIISMIEITFVVPEKHSFQREHRLTTIKMYIL